MAAEGEQAARKIGAALARAEDRHHERGQIVTGRQPSQQLLAVAVDDGQQVVEIVGQTAGQPADGLEALRVPELLAERLHLGFGARAPARRSSASASARRAAVPRRKSRCFRT